MPEIKAVAPSFCSSKGVFLVVFSRESGLLLINFGLLLVNFGLLLTNFGPLLVTFGLLLVNFGPLLVNFGLLSVTFGSLLTNFGLHSTESGFISVESGPWTARRRHSRMMYGGVYGKGKAFPPGNGAWPRKQNLILRARLGKDVVGNEVLEGVTFSDQFCFTIFTN